MIKIKLNSNWLFESDDSQLAIVEGDKKYFYSDLKSDVLKVTDQLIKNNFIKDDLVPIKIENSYLFIISIYAVWNIGAIPVPLNVKFTDSEIQNILKEIKTNKILIDRSESIINAQTIDISLFQNHNASSDHLKNYNSSDRALILFTSGTTNIPKGVVHSFNSLYKSSVNTDAITDTLESDKWLASLPFFHIGGFLIIIRALLTGSSLVIPKSLNSKELFNTIVSTEVNIISLVPTVLKYILKKKEPLPDFIKKIFIGGSSCSKELIIEALENDLPIVKVYGSSETCAMITAIEKPDLINHPLSSGKPLSGVELNISGINGEVLVKSDYLFEGYLNRDDSNINDEGFYRTGDVGYLDINNNLFVTSRLDDLIITGGENVNPAEIETILQQLPEIKEAVVFSLPDKKWGESICLAIVASNIINEQLVIEFLESKIAKYKIPKKILILKNIPKTELGKPIKSKLREMLLS